VLRQLVPKRFTRVLGTTIHPSFGDFRVRAMSGHTGSPHEVTARPILMPD
jgi:hypothetical protein